MEKDHSKLTISEVFQKNTIQPFIQNFIQHPISHAAAVWISPSLVMISMEQFFTAMVTFSWLFTSKLPMIPRNSDMGNLLVRPENGGRPCKGGSKKRLFPILPAYLAHWFLTLSSTTSLNKTSIYISFLSFFPFPCNHSPKLGGLQSEKIRRSESLSFPQISSEIPKTSSQFQTVGGYVGGIKSRTKS